MSTAPWDGGPKSHWYTAGWAFGEPVRVTAGDEVRLGYHYEVTGAPASGAQQLGRTVGPIGIRLAPVRFRRREPRFVRVGRLPPQWLVRADDRS
jgi:hypothetical protein